MSSEWGYASFDQQGNGVHEKQAKFAVRAMLMNIALGLPVSIWFDLWDREDNDAIGYGLFNTDTTPKLAADAMRTLTATLDGFTYSGQVADFGTGTWALAFENESQTALALWTTNGSEMLIVPAPPDCGVLTSLYGKELPYCWYGENIKIELTDEPQYLVFPR
jgi:hypothetical protein